MGLAAYELNEQDVCRFVRLGDLYTRKVHIVQSIYGLTSNKLQKKIF